MTITWGPEVAYHFFLLFARLGTIMMLLPALGEQTIPARMRLTFALIFAFVLYPLIVPSLGPMPSNLAGLAVAYGHELAIGFIIGGLIRLLLTAAQVAGAVIAYQMGLSTAQTADPTQDGVQGAIVGNFLAFTGVTLIFATDMHHMLLAGVYESYAYFPPDAPLMLGDAADMAVRFIAGSFVVGVQMSAPLLVFGLVFYLGLGILGRLMPQIQVFFMAMPANIIVGLILFAVLLGLIMGWYMNHLETNFALFRG
ncbi:flagellar biosynthetic protein FliR [Pelagibacterium xiamenense]|uniref:flagellar biosynthetic protein FliR n=1 Tax=Pelagibacterium xiamenense TaxID=2901140 RepID=UPI001E4D8AA8|nr:flagellar biosynthetic protein FliR [Pelagibacterium xiamenense]MCD7059991.1 flagellar type III secretion system protein FliR [Pelagibacterium xiamenense]